MYIKVVIWWIYQLIQYRSFWRWPFQAMHIHIMMQHKVKSLQKKSYIEHKTQKWPKPKIATTADSEYVYTTVIAVLTIFPLILQIVINLIMLSIGRQRAECIKQTDKLLWNKVMGEKNVFRPVSVRKQRRKQLTAKWSASSNSLQASSCLICTVTGVHISRQMLFTEAT